MGGKKKAAKVEVPEGDAQKGKEIFASQCSSCHGFSGTGKGSAAPPLGGIVGRKSGSTEFAYSKALKKSGIVWTKENIFQYIQAPAKFIAGNVMSFGGLPDPEQRADLIAYLNMQK